MAKTPVGDQLVRALTTIDKLQEAMGKYEQLLVRLVDRMADMDKRLAAVEKATKP